MTARGLLIAFEGGDGNGKSTQARLLAERIDAVLTRQAGGTPLGQRIRSLTLDSVTEHISDRAEALLYMADRAEHVDEVIEPALAAGQHVVTDRYAYSSLAYQGYGRGLNIEELRHISDWAMGGLWPDVVLLVDVPFDVSSARLAGRNAKMDHYEASGEALQQRVLKGYQALAAADPSRWRHINGLGSIDEVAARVWSVVEPMLGRDSK